MTQVVQHVAYGMNSDSIPKMKTKQLIAAFFQADTNMPSIKPEYRSNIRHNMSLIADEMSDRADAAKGRTKISLEVQLMVMQVIVKKMYAENY